MSIKLFKCLNNLNILISLKVLKTRIEAPPSKLNILSITPTTEPITLTRSKLFQLSLKNVQPKAMNFKMISTANMVENI